VASLVASKELADLGKVVTTDIPESSKAGFGAFKSAEDTKDIALDPTDPLNKVRIGTALSNE
jgi:hypothetical protein